MTKQSAFEIDQIAENKMEHSISLAYAMILSSNDPATCPDLNTFLGEVTDINTLQDIITKSSKELQDFFRAQPGDKDDQEQEQEDSEPKNA